MVTEEEFDAAVKQVINNQINDPEIKAMAKLIFPAISMIFGHELKEILFGKSEENKED